MTSRLDQIRTATRQTEKLDPQFLLMISGSAVFVLGIEFTYRI